MHPFQAEIGGQQHFVTGRDFEDGAVIPDAEGYASPSGSSTPDARDQQFLSEGQDEPTIKEGMTPPTKSVREGRSWRFVVIRRE
jgi:hypothetical protein